MNSQLLQMWIIAGNPVDGSQGLVNFNNKFKKLIMKFTELRPILWSDKLQETIDFYTNILGFACGERNDEWGWASLCRDNIEIMLSKPNEHTPFSKPIFTGSFYIRTDNVDEVWGSIKDKAKIVYEIENFDWPMREFAIYDNNGYILQFGQEII